MMRDLILCLAVLLIAEHGSAAKQDAIDWPQVRTDLVESLFGSPWLPTKSTPDFIENILAPQTGGCLCSTRGECNYSDCMWNNNMTALTWTIEARVNESYTLALNSTVFHTLNTSGVAAHFFPPVAPPEFPNPLIPAKEMGKTLLIFHNGHNEPQDLCVYDYDGTVSWANQLGYDVMNINMPLYSCNERSDLASRHQWFKQFEDQGVPTMRFFLEPVVLSINYAIEVLGYERIIMAGLSGGGWTTTMMAGIDPRIALSFPVAGSIPCTFDHTSWDYEQLCYSEASNNTEARPWAQLLNKTGVDPYEALYTLAAYEKNRYSVQVIHEKDPCCFHGALRHGRIMEYNERVGNVTDGRFKTCVTVGNLHEVNFRDQVVISSLADKLILYGKLQESDLSNLPFNTLQQWGP